MTAEEARAIIHLASRYFANTLVGVTPERARELILQAAGVLGEKGPG